MRKRRKRRIRKMRKRREGMKGGEGETKDDSFHISVHTLANEPSSWPCSSLFLPQ